MYGHPKCPHCGEEVEISESSDAQIIYCGRRIELSYVYYCDKCDKEWIYNEGFVYDTYSNERN